MAAHPGSGGARMTRKYAHDTVVPVAKSRGEIDHLLRQWGCRAISWADEFDDGVAVLRFRWKFEDIEYTARFVIRMPADAVITLEYRRPPTATQLAGKRRQRWMALHRVLFITIKAQLNAVDAGLITAVEAFLPNLENDEGLTVAEIAIPNLRLLTERGGGQKLLEVRR